MTAVKRITLCDAAPGEVLGGVLGYCFLVFIARLVGRRPGKQMTRFGFVLIFLAGGVTLTPMVGDMGRVVDGTRCCFWKEGGNRDDADPDLAGLLGRGPLAKANWRSGDEKVAVQYERMETAACRFGFCTLF